jgi:hypothetical protein
MLLRETDYIHTISMKDCLPSGTIAIYETWGDNMIVLYGDNGNLPRISGGDPETVVPWCQKHGLRLSPFDWEGEGYGWWIDFDSASQRDDFIRAWKL